MNTVVVVQIDYAAEIELHDYLFEGYMDFVHMNLYLKINKALNDTIKKKALMNKFWLKLKI